MAPRKWSSETPSVDDASLLSESDWQLETGNEEDFRTRRREPRSAASRLRSLLPGAGSGSAAKHVDQDGSLEDGGLSTARWQRNPKSKIRRCLLRFVWRLPVILLSAFGILHLILALLAQKNPFWDRVEYAPGWGTSGHPGEGLADYPTDATRDVRPIPCHSHNDYWRRIPLFDALSWGCTSVEADVWQIKGHDDLLVGHGRSSLSPKRTFTSLYINPLVQLLDSMNPTTDFANTTGHGVFDTDPNQTLVLLVDFKTNGEALFPLVHQHLQPLREKDYLSYWNGTTFNSRAITVVGTGEAPFDLLIANTTHRDIFFDAPIDELYAPPPSPHHHPHSPRDQGKSGTNVTTPFDSSNSYYASTMFTSTIGLPYGTFSTTQLDVLRGQLRGAHERGLKARYWETPAWPTSLRNRVWEVLVREGADVLNVDDLRAAANFDWRERVGHGILDA